MPLLTHASEAPVSGMVRDDATEPYQVEYMHKEMKGLSRADRVWITSMRICRKCSGCHQMPERSFFIGKYQLPLCARCTGIVIGHAAGAAVSLFHPVSRRSLIGTLPLMIDGMVQKYTSYESTNRRRLATGILYGFATMSACIRGIRFLIAWIRRD